MAAEQPAESISSIAESTAALCCELCGKPDAIKFGGRLICEECRQGCGSCCPEFGKDDLWKFDE